MKKGMILIVLLIYVSFSYAEVLDVDDVSDSEDQLRAGPVIKKFIYAGNSVVASVKDSNIEYYHQDRLSNRITTDSSGNKDKESKSLPFGQNVLNSGVDYPFTGKEEDESSLYYFGARYYDDNLGRWISVDPVATEPPYQYVSNNPMNAIDPDGTSQFDMRRYNLGDNHIDVGSYENNNAGNVLFFNMHDNENVAVAAGRHYVNTYGGRMIDVRGNSQRYQSVTTGSQTTQFDPNRIFTDAGRSSQAGGNSVVAGVLQSFASALIEDYNLDYVDYLVALHNTVNYNINMYGSDGRYAADASGVYINPSRDPHNFFFVTDKNAFDFFSGAGHNVVLQNPHIARDDGSLSYWAAQNGVNYINIEAQHMANGDHLAQQIEMLDVLHSFTISQKMELASLDKIRRHQ